MANEEIIFDQYKRVCVPFPKVRGVKNVGRRPPGWHRLHEIVQQTTQAVKANYHDWTFWLPKSQIRFDLEEEIFVAPPWLIDKAKNHGSTERHGFRMNEV